MACLQLVWLQGDVECQRKADTQVDETNGRYAERRPQK